MSRGGPGPRGSGAGQGHHTPRLGSDKQGAKSGGFRCPKANRGRERRGGAGGCVWALKGSSVAPERGQGRARIGEWDGQRSLAEMCHPSVASCLSGCPCHLFMLGTYISRYFL